VTTLRERWAAGTPTLGAWLSIPSTMVAEVTARTGFDYVCADLQHGALDYADSVGLFQAVLLGGATPIARVPWNEPGIVGKILDAGAEAVVAPMVNSAEEATAVVHAARYPPLGARSFGPIVAGPRSQTASPRLRVRQSRPSRPGNPKWRVAIFRAHLDACNQGLGLVLKTRRPSPIFLGRPGGA